MSKHAQLRLIFAKNMDLFSGPLDDLNEIINWWRLDLFATLNQLNFLALRSDGSQNYCLGSSKSFE